MPTTAAQKQDTGTYVVIIAGACFSRPNGEPGLAHMGHVVELGDDEARRLLMLDAIRAATDADVKADRERRDREAEIAAQNAAGPDNNPFGGRVVGTTLEKHAAEQMELAKKAGRA